MLILLVAIILTFSFFSYVLFNAKNNKWQEFPQLSTSQKIVTIVIYLIVGYVLFSFVAAALPPSVFEKY